MRINATALVGKDNGTFEPSAEDYRDSMVGKIVAENLLTTYTELYYRVVFCGKSRTHHGKMLPN
jgi:S-adenosylmethionine hydrolase